MPRRLIDISVPLQAGIASDPEYMLPQIAYDDHHVTAPRMAEYMGVRVDQFPDGEFAAVERCAISTHNGTPLDAPYHYFSTMNHALKPGGEPSWRIDEVPLEWCYQPAVKLDFRHLPDGYVATPGDIEGELKRIGHTLRPLEIVVVNTAAGQKYGQDDYVEAGWAWARRRPCGCWSAACAWSAPTAGAGRSLLLHPAQGGRDGRGWPHLGGPSRRAGDRLLTPGKAQQPRAVAGRWLRGDLLSRQDPSRFRGLD